MSKFKFRGVSAETVSARAKQSGGSYDSYLTSTYSFLKVKEGANDLRILPPTWDVDGPWGDSWGIEVYVHRDIGPDKGTYLCIDKMREKYGAKAVPSKLGECPLCAARHDVPDDDEEALKALKPGKQILALVVDRNAEKDGPQVWRMGWQMERDIQLRSQDKKSGAIIQITHPDNGFDLSFTREGSGLKTKYVGVDIAREDSPLAEKQVRQDKWLDLISESPLPEQLVFFDAAYLEQVYMGKRGSKGGSAPDEEEDDRPTRTKRPAAEEEEDQPRRRKAPAAEEEDDPPPRRKPRDEEEEEEEQPRRGRSAEPDEEEDRPRRRRAAEEEEDDRMPTDAEMKRNGERLRKRPAEEEEDEPPPRRRPAAREEEDEPAPRKRSRDPEDEEDEPQPRRTSAKRPAAEEEEEEDEPAPKGKASDRAKESLKRLSGKK